MIGDCRFVILVRLSDMYERRRRKGLEGVSFLYGRTQVAEGGERQQEFLAHYLQAQRSVRQLLRVLMRNDRLLEDACQAVALRLWEIYHSYDHSRPFDVWARGVAARVALEINRGERGNPILMSPEAADAVLQAFDRSRLAQLEHYQQSEALEMCLKAMPRHSRQLIVNRYHQSLPVDEIARQQGRTVAAIYKAIERSVQSLAKCVQLRLITATEKTV